MLTKTAGKVNQVIYWGRPLDWKNQTLTPNPDALYFMAFFNTKDGPVVIEMPPGDATARSTATSSPSGRCRWRMRACSASTRARAASSDPAARLCGQGARRLHRRCSPTPSAAMCCSARTSRATATPTSQESVAYGKRIKVYPLSQAANPPATVFTDVKDVLFDSTIRYDVSFFEHLDRIVQSEPWLDRDRAMIDQLKSIGIEKGKPFKPERATKALLNSASAKAQVRGSRPNTTPACRRSSPRAAAGRSRRRRNSSRRRSRAYADPTPIRSRARAWPTAMPTSASSGWRGPVLSDLDQGQGRRQLRRRQDLSPHGAAERAGRAILVGDGL